jgi:pyruvate dehydrogenase E2 component (dihydrolipoamide acetyltransferase)
MPIKILMPALSPTMTEGNLAKWLKAEGEAVKPGDVIAEIETDKATMEVEAIDEGTLGKILVPAGAQAIKVNEPIALLLAEGEDASALAAPTASPAPAAPAPPKAPEAAAAPPAAPAPPAATPQAARPQAATPQAATPQAATPQAATQPTNGAERRFASPLARRMAEAAGLDLATIGGSGPNGRIVKSDVEAALARSPAARPAAAPEAAAAPGAPAPAPIGLPPFTEVPNSQIRKVIARRLGESKRDAPHFYLSIDCEIDQLLKIRQELNGRASDKYKLSVNDFVIRASALALKQVPAANASWTEAAIRLYRQADISVAVAAPSGLITPIIRQADAKGLAAISNEMKELAGRAREGKLKPEEYQGGTFSVSNLGMHGIKSFAAVINPPQGAILAVGTGEQRPVVKEGALAIATMMTCTLSVDHRVVDGAIGAEFLAAFKKLIEDPLTMLL